MHELRITFNSLVAPSAPRFLNITASTETSVTLSWMPPDPPNGPLSVYSITYYAEDNELPRNILAFGTTLTISSLQSGVVYIVDVTASTISEEGSLIFGVPATLRIMDGVYKYVTGFFPKPVTYVCSYLSDIADVGRICALAACKFHYFVEQK